MYHSGMDVLEGFLEEGDKLQSISEEGKRVQNPVFSEKYYRSTTVFNIEECFLDTK